MSSSSSPYAILGNRPIDKWKVTELREELKRRGLVTRGLKEDLVKRLDEDIRLKQEESERLQTAALPAAVAANQQADITPLTGGDVTPDRKQTTHVAPFEAPFFIETTTEVSGVVDTTPSLLFSKSEVDAVTKVDDVRGVADIDNSVADLKPHEPQKLDVKDGVESEVTAYEHLSRLDDGDFKAQPTESVLEKCATYNQVSEIIPVTGFEVKSDCISIDTVSNNEKLEFKENEIADNVKVEQNVNKYQEPSTVVGESHPMDVEEPLEQKISVGGGHRDATNADMAKENNNIDADAGDSEKLNLDRSSGDESMEDEPDTKQTESITSNEVLNESENIEMLTDKDETPEIKNHPMVASEKRKFPVNDQVAVEPAKRQRRWNSESIKVPEVKATNTATPTTTPRSTDLKRNISGSDSSVSEDGPKERVVPPSPKEPTNSLRIDRFLRPFTLKAVQELLGKTGSFTSFWMDNIKTHCYVSYSSVEEAAATREAVYNLQWPPNGGRLLIAEFVRPEEVKAKVEAPLPPTPQPQPQAPLRPPPTTLPPPPPLAKLPHLIERLPLPPPPPPVLEEQEPPIVTLDDLFKKTKAIPRIYYLPLSKEQVAAKLAAAGN